MEDLEKLRYNVICYTCKDRYKFGGLFWTDHINIAELSKKNHKKYNHKHKVIIEDIYKDKENENQNSVGVSSNK